MRPKDSAAGGPDHDTKPAATGAAGSGAPHSEPAGIALVYRDRIVPRSEAGFLRRQYVGFSRLAPVWVGCRTDDGLAELGVRPLMLGRTGLLGVLDRALFKQFAVLPRQPDLASLQPRVLHAHFGRGGALALPIARALGIPLVVTFHGGDATKDKHFDHRLIRTIFQRRLAELQREAALFIAVSDFIGDTLIRRGFPPEKVRVIRYGVEIEDAAPPQAGAEPTDRPPYVLFVGRFVEKKGIEYLIEAMQRLAAGHASAPLVLVGDGPRAAALRRQAASLPDTTFAGWVGADAVRRFLRGALVLCVPSVAAETGDAEGLPNVVLEAMAAGVPVIGSRHAGIGEAVEDGVTGLLVPPGDAGALAAAIGSLLQDPGRRHAMGKAAWHRARERFSATGQSRRLEDALLGAAGLA